MDAILIRGCYFKVKDHGVYSQRLVGLFGLFQWKQEVKGSSLKGYFIFDDNAIFAAGFEQK